MRNCKSFFPKHNFGKWEDYRQFVSERTGIVFLIQKRVCEKCGKTELRTQTSE